MTTPIRLDQICSGIVDCEHKTAPLDDTGEYFAVGTPAMRLNSIDVSEARRISKETFEMWTRRMSPRLGDLLLAREAPVGPIVRIPNSENIAPGQRTVLLRPDPRIVDSAYLYYLLISPAIQTLLHIKAAGSTVAHLNVADVRSSILPILPLNEQRAIAEVLGALDDKIAANTELAHTASKLARLMVAGQPASVPLAEIVNHHKSTLSPHDFGTDLLDHYSLPAFDAGEIPESAMPSSIKSGKFKIDCACVLVSKLNPRFPRIWDIPAVPKTPAIASTEFLVLEPRFSTSSVLWSILGQPSFSDELQSKAAGTSGSHQRVRPADLLATHVIDPRKLSGNALDAISDLGATVAHCRIESQTLAETRDALLPHLMSGRLRVKDAEKQIEELV